MHFGFQSELCFSLSLFIAFLCHYSTSSGCKLREMLHNQSEKEGLEVPAHQHYSTFTDQTSSLCVVCLHNSCRWHVSPHWVYFSQTRNPCRRRENGTTVCHNCRMKVLSFIVQTFQRRIQDRSLPLCPSARCLCPNSGFNGISAHLGDSALNEDSKREISITSWYWSFLKAHSSPGWFHVVLLSDVSEVLATTACLFFSVSAVSVTQWHRGS